MDYYFEHCELPLPDFGFSPDAEFPIINGEKGNITEYLHFVGKMMEKLFFTALKLVLPKIWFQNLQLQ